MTGILSRYSLVFLLINTATRLFTQQLLTSEEVIARVLKHNFSIQLARMDSASAAMDEKYAYGALLPQINAVVGTNWNNNDQRQKFIDGTIRERDGVKSHNINASVQLNWLLFDGMRMFVTRERLKEIASLGEWNVKNEVINITARTATLYYDIVRQKQQLKAIEEQMAVSEERVKVAERKLSTGLGSKPELLQAKVDLNAQQARRLQQITLIAQLKELLNQLAGGQLDLEFDVADHIPIDTLLSVDRLRREIENNPSLIVARRNIGIAQLNLQERKAERWPTLSFNSAYNINQIDNQTVVNPFQPLVSRANGFNFGLSANIPILNNRLTERNIEQRLLSIDALKMNYTDRIIQIETQLINTFRDYEYQKMALKLEEENIELAKENVVIALERFRQGVSTFLELREAQKSLEEAYNRLIAARYNAKAAEIDLFRLCGEYIVN